MRHPDPVRRSTQGTYSPGCVRAAGPGGALTSQAHEGICFAHVRSIVLRVRPAPVAAPPSGGRRPLPRPRASRGSRARRGQGAARSGDRDPTAQRETRLVRPSGRPAAHGDRVGAPDLPGVRSGAGAAPQRTLRAPGRHHWTQHRRRQVLTGPLPRVGRADPPRDSRIPLVRPAPPSGAGAETDRGGPGQLHTRDRADAGPGRGTAPAPGGGPAPRGHQGGTRRDLPTERLAAAGGHLRRPARLPDPHQPVPRAGSAHRPGPGRPAEAAARHRGLLGPARHGPVLPRRRTPVQHPPVTGRSSAGGLGARGLVSAGLRPGDAVVGPR